MQVLNSESESIAPEFDAQRLEEFFAQVYSADQQHFSFPDWLPLPPSPVHLNTEAMSVEELYHKAKII